MAGAPTDEEIYQAVEAVPDELRQYGIDVRPFAGVNIIREHRLPEKPDARGSYSPNMDIFSLYKPFFEQDEPLRPTVIHEYVHKDQWLDAADASVSDDYRRALAYIEERYQQYLDDLETLGVEPGFRRHAGITAGYPFKAAPRALARNVSPQYDAIHAAAQHEAERWDDPDREQEVHDRFDAALMEELDARNWGDAGEIYGQLYDMMQEDGFPAGDAPEIEAYYTDIALSSGVDDEDYIQHEYSEIRKPGKGYHDPDHIINALTGAIEEHRERRAAGEDEQAIITDIRRTLRADIPDVDA